MKRFIGDFKKYFNYMIYATKATLREEVVNSHLGALWWILDPLCFMLIYTFISVVVFKSSEQYFPIFVFIGLSAWNFFNHVMTKSAKLVRTNRDTVTKVYLPKWVLLLVVCFVELFKMMVSFVLVAIAMAIYGVPATWDILYAIPILIVLFVVTFGFGSIFMHFGVFVEDLSNITNIALRFTFYLSGIFFAISKRVPKPYSGLLLTVNPIGLIIESLRHAILYGTPFSWKRIVMWFVIGVVLSVIGVRTIYKYENSYVKVIK